MHDWHAVQEFLEVAMGKDVPPDKTAILPFRHLLERHGLGPMILKLVNQHLAAYGIRLERGTVMDATVLEAPCSTKNQKASCDPEMGSTKKEN